jgi:hypothetical protein
MRGKYMKRAAFFIALTFAGCQGMQGSVYRNVPDEKTSRIFAESTDKLGMDYGYNSKLETAYFYFISDQDSGSVKNDKELAGVLDKYGESEILNAYVEIYRINEVHQFLLSYYQKRKLWVQYNSIKNNYLASAQLYSAKFDNYVHVKYPQLYGKLDLKKREIKKNAILMYQEKFNVVDAYY